MTVGYDDPAVHRRKLCVELRKARLDAGKAQRQVAEAMEWSFSKLTGIEDGKVRITENELLTLLQYYNVTDKRRIDPLLEMATVASEASPSDEGHGKATCAEPSAWLASLLEPLGVTGSVLESLGVTAFKRARRILGNRQDAEDIAQETLAALVKRARSGLPPLDHPDRWVTRVARNLALNELRRQAKAAENSKRLPCQTVQDFADRVAARLLVDELLDVLPARQREALELQFLDDLAQLTVADIMEIRAESVKKHVSRAKKAARSIEKSAGEGKILDT